MRYFSAFSSNQLVGIRLLVWFLALLSPMLGWGQTNPSPYNLSPEPYTFSGFSNASTSYPTAIQGHSFSNEPDGTTVAPPAADVALAVGGAITNGNIRNEGLNGISLLNTTTNNIGAITLALNTTGRAQVMVNWLATVINGGVRINGLRLQYRLGETGSFTEVVDSRFESNVTGQSKTFVDVELPGIVNDQPVVQLRWLYYSASGSGTRTRIGLDEIVVRSSTGPSVPSPTISNFAPAAGPVGTVVTIEGTNFVTGVTVNFNGTAATTVNVVSATQLTAVVPTGSSTGPITVALGSKAGSSNTNFVVESLVGKVVISQIYGGGGNGGATYKNDFVELFNRSKTTIAVGGWSVQYASATGNFSGIILLPGTSLIPAGGYYLIQLAGSNTGAGANLPTSDLSGNTQLSAANGKVALASSSTVVTGPTSSNIVDFVGYGSANQSEGGSAAKSISATLAAARKLNGCQDTDNNNADFDSKVPEARNSGTPVKPCEPSGTLPVQLISFDAKRRVESVQIRWATATELNSSHFEVQRSVTGQQFRTIATVAAQGGSNSLHNYVFLDAQPLPGISYYRLRQLDLDGQQAYSTVVSVATPGQIRVYPNPVQKELRVELVAGGHYRIISAVGSVLLAGPIDTNTAVLHVAALPAGLYQLEITSPAGREIRKIVKQ